MSELIEDIPVNPQEIIRIRNLGIGYESVIISSRILSLLCDGVEMLRRANERLIAAPQPTAQRNTNGRG